MQSESCAEHTCGCACSGQSKNERSAKPRRGLKWMLALTAMILLLTFVTDSTGQTTSAESDSVTVPIKLLRRATAAIDSLDREIAIRDIRLAYADSVAQIRDDYWKDEVQLLEESRQRLVDACAAQEDNWFERFVKDPRLWFIVGASLGLLASN